MKKSLLALVVLGAFASAASAQSSVTIFGKIDQAIGKPIGTDNKQVIDGAGSRLAFRGFEDLGGGLAAVFAFEHRFNPDTGTTGTATSTTTGATTFWDGYSYVGVRSATLGTVTIGRHYTSSFQNVQAVIDVFAGETVAAQRNIFAGIAYGSSAAGADTANNFAGGATGAGPARVRVANSVKYTGTFGGFTVGGDIGETIAGQPDRGYSATLTYAGGPLWAGLAYDNAGGADDQVFNVAAKYTFGPATIGAGLTEGKVNLATNNKIRAYIVNANINVGAGDIKVGYVTSKVNGTAQNARIGVGYHHNLSKRTKLYVDFARESKIITANKTGYDLGVQHNF